MLLSHSHQIMNYSKNFRYPNFNYPNTEHTKSIVAHADTKIAWPHPFIVLLMHFLWCSVICTSNTSQSQRVQITEVWLYLAFVAVVVVVVVLPEDIQTQHNMIQMNHNFYKCTLECILVSLLHNWCTSLQEVWSCCCSARSELWAGNLEQCHHTKIKIQIATRKQKNSTYVTC